MSTRCRCARCTLRSLMGPAVVVTIGVLFLLHEVRGGFLGFDNTYPFILIVIGAILLASAVAPTEGHVDIGPAPPAPPPGATPSPTQSSTTGHGS